ncbi:PREDICTED: tyrosine-protein kinase hopscotch [Nicrophorus vespilloides]|uniref:non-specific protein-tyrosine kinase n=1 Tax=Nicrophorus vespilloides TaxID=110193 RepID=A0ABM1MUX8_NICVS|nr:PREDICTED: tyrosine-protein kinase hopscotch [Nicrophorus vespilloides]XP_017778378.1 PREDICTED: tyrosine-protein kinase hopscotch [Nicrophorus vespilloides]
MAEFALKIKTLTDNKLVPVQWSEELSAEDVCITLCKQLNISTVARHLFALRESTKCVYLHPSATFEPKSTSTFDLRIRFKVGDILWLKKIDIKAFDYYFHQARNDVLDSKIPDLVFEKYRRELMGLGVTDMYRVMLEKDIPRESVESEYKKYIPKEVLKKHMFFIKKPIHEILGKIGKSGHDAWYVKEEYLKQLEMMSSDYPIEEYKALTDQNGSLVHIIIRVTPFHPTEPGVKYCIDSKREKWVLICSIEELGFISIRMDCTVEIYRKNGIPFYMKFTSLSKMYSFVSLLDGYYRLSVKWTFNICKEVSTPSLQRLQAMKCHGPVGGEFSYAKLEEKRGNKPGCFILRESESKYNIIFVDVCMKDSLKPKTYKIERLSEEEFIFNDDLTRYSSIGQLMSSYGDPQKPIYLLECLPPSEYDKSPLLLCKEVNMSGDSLTDGAEDTSIPSVPVCINIKDLQVYKTQKKEGSEGFTSIYKGMWRHAKGKKMEIAMKILKTEHRERFLKDFLEMAGKWAFVQSNVIVRFFGLTLTSQLSVILEFVRLGPLDQYLRDNINIIKAVDLVEAVSNLASALWHLSENGIVHGHIRCRKLLVSCHDQNSFTVKLADPGIHSEYLPEEVHWLPLECYPNMNYSINAKTTAADVWAFGTTVWEIFMYGESIKRTDHVNAKKFYASGKRLSQPQNCPSDIYKLMLECWDADMHRRKQPQAISRDINQILYQVYNSRRVHAYAKIKNLYSHSTESIYSNYTESTNVTNQEDLISVFDMHENDSDLSKDSLWSVNSWSNQDATNNEACGLSSMMSNFNYSTATTSLESINAIQSIFELDDDCNVVLQGRIGQGFYGEVYKGTLEHIGDKESPPQLVAIKKLKSSAVSSCLQDFEREISIMKTLKHPNIVQILGVLQEPEISLVMEFVNHGSLQSYLKIYKDTLTSKQLLKYASDIAEGMHYLGSKNIVHRDLAARNILVVDENHVKISDFGLAQVVINDYYILTTVRELPIKWYALESLRDGKFSIKSDVWSYGVTMCEMFSNGDEPNLPVSETEGQEQQILLDALEKGTRFPCPLKCPQSVYVRVIYPCWYKDPHIRPSFQEIGVEIEKLLKEY